MMDENRYINMLEEHNIKPTANRLIVLHTLDGKLFTTFAVTK